jgi:sulfite exporter TauE/SafE
LAGLLGSAVSFSGAARGVVALIAGLLVIIVGLNMIGFFRWTRHISLRLPSWLQLRLFKLQSTRRPFLVGIANGFMPCGPLQAMQFYALGTGGFLLGARAMLVFGLGTFPLVFAFGIFNTFLSQKFAGKILKTGAVVVTAMGLAMVSRGLALSGISLPVAASGQVADGAPVARVQNGVQVVRTVVDQNGYQPGILYLKKGVPVRWEIEAKSLNGCNNPITVPELGIQKQLKAGLNIIQFTPKKEGPLVYSCWMGMITAKFQVVSDLNKVSNNSVSGDSNTSSTGGGCCGPTPARFRGGRIPVDRIGVAKLSGGSQQVAMKVDADGYSPAVLVVQKGIPALWTINALKLSTCTDQIVFPDIEEGLNLREGENRIRFTPEEDLSFRCGMGMLNGYIKVVDDLKKVDLAQVAREIKSIKPAASSSCCS